MRFGWLTLSLSPSPEEDAARIDQQIKQVRFAEPRLDAPLWRGGDAGIPSLRR
jgi:hypothetical protein